jgi:hypothetical protein
MTPTILSTYLRVIFVYLLGAALAAESAWMVVKHADYTNPIVYVAIAYWSSILGVHINNIGTPNPSVSVDQQLPVDPIAAATSAGLPDSNATGAATPPVA